MILVNEISNSFDASDDDVVCNIVDDFTSHELSGSKLLSTSQVNYSKKITQLSVSNSKNLSIVD
jgi:hypothetical protein